MGVKVVGGLREASTPWGGVSLVVELFRRSGLGMMANRVLLGKGLAKGLKQGQTVESFVLLSALGGDCIEDIERLRQDEGFWWHYLATVHRLLRKANQAAIIFSLVHRYKLQNS